MQLIPFDSGKLPAHIQGKNIANPFAAAAGGGFKILSIKSKVFTIVDGDTKTKTMVTKPGDDGPASSIEVVIVAHNPTKSKVYYKDGYTEGSDAKPLCYSNNGTEPEKDAAEPQAKKCAACPHNVFGSKITENGQKAKACADSMRLAIAPAGQLNDPMLLRVPAASLKALGSYGSDLAKRGVEPHQVVTRIGFDYTVAYPALTFKPVGFVTDEMMSQIDEVRGEDVVQQIIGTMPVVEGDEFAPAAPAAPKAETPPPAEKPAKQSKPAAKPAPASAPAPAAAPLGSDDLPTTPKATVTVETAADAVGEIVGSVDDLDFDD